MAPDDLDDYWQEAIADARARAGPAVFEPYRRAVYRNIDVSDVTFTGAGGDPVRALVRLSRRAQLASSPAG